MRFLALCLLIVMLTLPMSPQPLPVTLVPAAHAANLPSSFADTVEKLLPTVVNIQTQTTVSGEDGLDFPLPPGSPLTERFWEEFRKRQLTPRQTQAQGSGFVIDAKKGLIVTNNHVIENASEILAVFQDNRKLEATLVGRDPQTDLAVLKVKPFAGMKAVPWANSDKVRVGDWVLAIGNPLGLGGTVTSGIVSARGRDIQSGPYDDYLQTDAPINRGNSGGPLFNIQGQVVGINTAIFSSGNGGSIGIAFSIPSNLARDVVGQLTQYGTTRRGWLGVYIQEVTEEIAQGLGLDKAEGALVSSVQDNSPAGDAGIKPGDVIVKFNGVGVDNNRSLPRIVAGTKPKQKVAVEIVRNGKKQTLTVTIGRLEDHLAQNDSDEPEPKQEKKPTRNTSDLSELGVRVVKLTAELRRRYEIAADVPSGLLVLELIDNETSLRGHALRPGMVITQISQENTLSLKSARAALKRAKQAQKQSVLLRVYLPNGMPSFVGVRLRDN